MRLIQFEHRGNLLLSVKDENIALLSVTVEEQGKSLAYALGVPLFLRNEPESVFYTPMEAAVRVQQEFELDATPFSVIT